MKLREEAFGDDKPIRFQVLRSVLAETYLAIVENIEAENASSGRSDFIRYPRNPPYDPPPVVITRNFEEFKDALKTHGTYMEINVPVDVHPYIHTSTCIPVKEIDSKDWINELPESVLSFLTIKEAAGTSMICHRWRHRQLWLDYILTRRDLEFNIPNIFGSNYLKCRSSLISYFEDERLLFFPIRIGHIINSKAFEVEQITLYLERVTVDEVFMASMFSICLFLESLSLLGCSIDSSLIVDGPSLRLDDLKVLNCFNDPANIKISAVNLASFEYSGNIHHISSIKTPRLSRIYFNNHMVQNAFPHALTRLASFPQLVKELPESLPTFRNLKQLELVVHGPEKSSKDNELVWGSKVSQGNTSSARTCDNVEKSYYQHGSR
ncbi:PREDICTED: F-box/FBD/LRR-repeat [Prunus dulcis]|uniref:PREDICTED: F-box/FBD/LRR-repeat n=1 Tax=Prunus dulcis TaxID=3755 RepID=A0A5E4FQJ5_PRUDU|nr:PREDICTED: F-box/FBD/LRR-repeat [Prunus dulcis]